MYKDKCLQADQLRCRSMFFLTKFIVGKHLKQEVNEDLCVCVNERSHCGLSITGDIINVT